MPGETIVMDNGDPTVAQRMIERSRENYARRFVKEPEENDMDTGQDSKPKNKEGRSNSSSSEPKGYIPKKKR